MVAGGSETFMVLGEAQKNLAVINKRNFESSGTGSRVKGANQMSPRLDVLYLSLNCRKKVTTSLLNHR